MIEYIKNKIFNKYTQEQHEQLSWMAKKEQN